MFQKSNIVKHNYVADLWLTVTVHDQHKAKTIKSQILHGITIGVAPHRHGIIVNVVPITAVFPPSPLPCRPHAAMHEKSIRITQHLRLRCKTK